MPAPSNPAPADKACPQHIAGPAAGRPCRYAGRLVRHPRSPAAARDGHPAGPASPQARRACRRVPGDGAGRADRRGQGRSFPRLLALRHFRPALHEPGRVDASGTCSNGRAGTTSRGPGVQWNIFNYGRITNNVRLQDARFQELLITYQNTVLTAQQNVEDAIVAFVRSQERAEFLARSTEAAKGSLALAVDQYRGGVADFTTVIRGRAVAPQRAGQFCRHPRQHSEQPGGDLQGPGRRLADQGRDGPRAARGEGSHGKTDQLGQFAQPGSVYAARRGRAAVRPSGFRIGRMADVLIGRIFSWRRKYAAGRDADGYGACVVGDSRACSLPFSSPHARKNRIRPLRRPR